MKNSFLMLLMVFCGMQAMNDRSATLAVILNAPTHCWPDGVEFGGPRPDSLKQKYVDAFPQLQKYLQKNENHLKGFDARMFTVMKSCLRFSYLKKVKKNDGAVVHSQLTQWMEGCSGKDLVDAIDIAKMAGLPAMIQEAAHAQLAKKSLKIADIYPDHPDVQEYDESESEEEEPEQSSHSFAWWAWLKSFFLKKQVMNTELSLCKPSPFEHLIARLNYLDDSRLKNKPATSWWGAFKKLLAHIFWK